ncbi:LysR family transcriptional regulator [Paenibacillus marchantiophytorum]|uniref:LysR family transcriptional regulator n=1 Tax=Paenibacillus marchantiophytorum TaxID=1619310 RepID=A0ABQ1EUB8_9BACL|nr:MULTISPECIES: LysR family transcriptional regulator [Paenibacillus]UKS25950.1 LysR family transcriptional regulator [Paenibacillus sp. HWE-109]GFZ86863.1 LysR family transcriptional regulator [Paenibacillus marchantiophytorum]
MTLQQLKYILTIVNCGSISEAAKQLFISQPSLSSAVKEMEQEIGIEIFLRSSKGIALSNEGAEFLSYARQVVEQAELLEQRYMNKKPSKKLCSISTQHYAFSVQAFVSLLKDLNTNEYECTLRETRTHEIIEDVRNMRSELGILYLNDFNQKVIQKMLKENDLQFHPLFVAEPHVFISSEHPLAAKSILDIEDLDEFPCLAFEQGEYNSFYFSEEILSTRTYKKKILVSDRATLFNLLIGLNGYTISSGVLNSDLNGEQIKSVRLRTDENMQIGYITNKKVNLSLLAADYVRKLKSVISDFGYTIISQEEELK